MKPNAINYLSLARKAGRIEVGEEPAGAAARAGHARLLVVASDAPDNTVRRAKNFVAETDQQMIVVPFTKEEMGAALGRTVVAMAAMVDPSMALAFVQALEEPEKYGAVLEKLSVKAQRQRKRQQEEKAHQKNIRMGKFRKGSDERSKEKVQEPKEESGSRPQKYNEHHNRYGSKQRSGSPYGEKRSAYHEDRFSARGEFGKKPGYQGKKPYYSGEANKTQEPRETDRFHGGQKPRTERQSGKAGYGKKPQYGYRKPAYGKTGTKGTGRQPGRKTHGGVEV